MTGPCMCGAADCIRCHPENFRSGRYENPAEWCDECQEFADQVCDTCEWCGMQICGAFAVRHRESCKEGKTK